MTTRSAWAISLVAIGSALTQAGCTIMCPCKDPTAQTPGAAPAAADAPGGGAKTAAGGAAIAGTVPYKWKNVVVLGGGFVSGIVFSPVEKDLIFARTDVGGAYRWNQADKTWIPLNDDLPRDSNFLGIESVAADPVDANKVYLAVGTYTGSWVGNGAILRSNDKGNTWNTVDMPIKMGGNENGRSMGERLAIDPNQPSILFFGSRKNGLWKSTDSGAKWDKVAGFTASDGDKGIGIPLVFFDKKSGAKGKATSDVYAAVANNDGSLYRSTDAGVTWKLVPKQPTGVMASHAEFDSNGMLYLSYGNGPGPNDISDGAVWKFEPKTEKFTNITPVKPTADDKFGYGGLSVDAAHPGTLMVSTIDRWSKGDEIYRSTDGGKKWKALLPKVVRDDAGAKYLYWHKDEPIGRGWMGDIAIDPFNPGRVMYVTGAGIWGSEDANAADTDKPTKWTFLNRGLEETVIKGLVSPPAGPPLLSVMGDLCGFRHDDLNTPTASGMFDNPVCGSASSIDIAWGKPDIVARVGWPGWDGKGPWGATSADGGKTWTPFKGTAKGKGAGSIAVAADGSSMVAAPLEGPVVFSKDQGATWARAEGLPDAEKSPGLGAGAVQAGRRSREPEEVLRARRQGRAGVHERRRRRPLHPVAHRSAGAPRLSVQLRVGADDARLRGRHLAHQLQGAQSLGRFGQDLRGAHQRDRGLRAGLRQGGRRQELPGAVSDRQDRRRDRLLPLRRRRRHLGAHQRRPPPVRLLHDHHRRPARLRPRLHRHRRPRHHLRRAVAAPSLRFVSATSTG